MARYFDAKRILFNGCGSRPPRAAVINVDDEFGRALANTRANINELVLLYGIQNCDFRATNVDLKPDATTFDLKTAAGTTKIATPSISGSNASKLPAPPAERSRCGW